MDDQLYDFFGHPDFEKCFFTGKPVTPDEKVPVFPQWIQDRYDLSDKFMGMLNWNRVKYGELFVPCSFEAAQQLAEFEYKIRKAFESGYDEVIKLEKDDIFLWMAKILLGILYHDVHYSIVLGHKRNRPYKLSPLLTRKFSQLHFMLQSLVKPVRWTGRPYSMVIKKLNYSKDIFNFRDETNNLNFSLGMNGFGLIACLQDMGKNEEYHKTLLEKMGNNSLHAIQFEELCVKFIYSNFLMREHKGWVVEHKGNEFVLSPSEPDAEAHFRPWEDKMYASALQGYWEPWGIDPKEVYSFPDSPLSFLIDETTNEFITPDKIELPS